MSAGTGIKQRTRSTHAGPKPGDDPSLRIRLEVDNESTLPMLLEGRTVAVLGEPLDYHTAESRVPDRRLRLHARLLRARRLRASFEDAARRADAASTYGEALAVLRASSGRLRDLVQLTQDLRDRPRPTSEDDSVGSSSARVRSSAEEDSSGREGRILRRQLRDLARECHPGLEVDEALEARHDAKLSVRANPEQPHGDSECDDDDDNDGGGVSALALNGESDRRCLAAVGKDRKVAVSVTRKRHARAALSFDDVDSDNATDRERDSNNETETDEDFDPSTKASLSSSARKKAARAESKERAHPSAGAPGKAAASRKRPPPSSSPASSGAAPYQDARATGGRSGIADALSTTDLDERKSIAKKPINRSKRREGRPPKKCHDCKQKTTRYRQCNYWFVWGNRCSKPFCIECLSSKYSRGNDVAESGKGEDGKFSIEQILSSADFDSEWHCPSCLGLCRCKSCTKQRKKDEERERRTLEAAASVDNLRKSSRRSAAAAYYG